MIRETHDRVFFAGGLLYQLSDYATTQILKC